VDTDVVVIGAGPYGLAISAHLSERGVRHEIFGELMNTWAGHMPAGMYLKSEGFASNISDPHERYPLVRYCREHGIGYGDVAEPIRLDTFLGYGRWFQEQAVPGLRPLKVDRVRRKGERFELCLSDGETLSARQVVVATGVQGYAHLPTALRDLQSDAILHCFDHLDPATTRDGEAVVIGAGQSALESAALLNEQGASVRVLVRAPKVLWNSKPGGRARPIRERLRYPESGLGEGREQWFYANYPRAVHALPHTYRQRVAYTVLGPAGAWWLRPRIENQVEILLERSLVGAQIQDGRVHLQLDGPRGREEIETAQVIAGTGYRPDVGRLAFLDPALREQVASTSGIPELDSGFQSSVPGLYFVGYPAALSFGPVMRFVFGTKFTARRIARRLSS